ncbi:L-fuconate dehydratase [Salinibacterium amurskyense]|uniref:L-fuconate dehydratase n=1 Tax=Salinibacterium amurskyense TaxID=205941 RepID=A0A2M9D606_9MICO|nr:L-fuconate dehydratase [Salinibacterium amurskyense]PJJ81154.1 L-fuconate dehydratase [Salinibacterium amurskyense]RLQ83177.1 L-fuconate dehydratase [Salinibacterium amurskyense]GHD81473.1 l-fuconate dehydratase [Salinibacterium amurskyense]
MTTITSVDVYDVRFPTSLTADGSDAMNKDGDYSAAYVVLRTDEEGVAGYGFTFTIGRGNDICALAAEQRAEPLVGRDVDEIVGDLGGIYRELKSDSQLRWLGPEKGVEHLAMAAVMNAVWDLAARRANKPLWRLLTDMTPEQLVDTADLKYLSDAITRDEAIALLTELADSKEQRIAELTETGYPCYTTSAGWLGYSDEKLRRLCQEAVDAGYRHIKLKVGANLDEDIRRCRIAREVIGDDAKLMIDANQVWDVDEAIDWVKALAEFKPLWIEEPTSPDDVLGHAAIRKAVAPIGVATGEHGMNRVLFKQMFQAEAIDFCQLDSARLAGPNEIIAVYLMAKKFGVPVCPHAGGVGLCELVQHLSIFDYVAVSGTLENRVTEFVDHLHEHFVDPCIVENGAYRVPMAPGYSAQMHESSLAEFSFPAGSYWAGVAASVAS